MTAFRYTALDSAGKSQQGTLNGDCAKSVRQQLRSQGLTPLMVVVVSASSSANRLGLGNLLRGERTARLSLADLVFFTRQLALLLRAGFTIEQALEAMEEQFSQVKIKNIIRTIRQRVLEGLSLAHAIRDFDKVFPAIYSVSIEAGEQSGQLVLVLSRLADYAEQQQRIRQKIQQALIYPSITLLFSFGITVFLLTYLLPTLLTVFADNQQSLPGLTLFLLSFSHFLTHYGLIVLFIVISLAWLLRRSLKQPANRWRWHQFLVRVPLIRFLIKNNNSARYTRTLGVLCASGLAALDAMQLASKLITHLPMQQSLQQAANRVREGSAIHASLKQTTLFDPLTLNLIANGEQSGKLAELLEQAAEHQENELARFIEFALALLEPAMIIFMGGVVLFIVLAMLLPIFAMNQLVG